MKFTLVLALLVPAIAAMPAAEKNAEADVSVAGDAIEAMSCGSGLCRGFQDSSLCNNRVCDQEKSQRLAIRAWMLIDLESQCQNCSGPSGRYTRGECGGFAWQ